MKNSGRKGDSSITDMIDYLKQFEPDLQYVELKFRKSGLYIYLSNYAILKQHPLCSGMHIINIYMPIKLCIVE